MIMYCIFSPWALLDKLSEDDRIRLAISTASPTPGALGGVMLEEK